jgi:hypothetical protein
MAEPLPEWIATFGPLLDAARGLDLGQPARCEAELARRLDPRGPAARELNARLQELERAGLVAHKGAPPLRFSRAAKASSATGGYSIDVVHMSAPGPEHVHPRGEIDYCVAVDGAPTFDGRPPGWVVLPPGSRHVPTVAGGTMLIVYLLPDGAIEFIAAPRP